MMRDTRKPRPGIPPASSDAARKRMETAKGQDTKPERQLRSHLHRLGLRFRLQQKLLDGLRRKADIVFRPVKVVVFIDGCFWHGCPVHGTWPKLNAEFWRDKIESNRRRDADTDARLAEAGWHVIRVWEHEDPLEAARRIEGVVRGRRK
jgi:DNA mismatch endonuclease, patch repair protein